VLGSFPTGNEHIGLDVHTMKRIWRCGEFESQGPGALHEDGFRAVLVWRAGSPQEEHTYTTRTKKEGKGDTPLFGRQPPSEAISTSFRRHRASLKLLFHHLLVPRRGEILCHRAARFFHGSGFNNWDLAVLKNVPIRESKTLEFRTEWFNAFNHAQFNAPDGNINDSTFGVVISAQPPRIGQLAVKFIF
jgi:hypothetical protein